MPPYDFRSLARRDLHVHTPYCNHAHGSMEDYVRAGLAAGLEELGFLAHVEAGVARHFDQAIADCEQALAAFAPG